MSEEKVSLIVDNTKTRPSADAAQSFKEQPSKNSFHEVVDINGKEFRIYAYHNEKPAIVYYNAYRLQFPNGKAGDAADCYYNFITDEVAYRVSNPNYKNPAWMPPKKISDHAIEEIELFNMAKTYYWGPQLVTNLHPPLNEKPKI